MRTLRFWVYPTVPSFPTDDPDLAGAVGVAIDVLRATTTIAQALWAGAQAVVPFREPDEARAAARAAGWSPVDGSGAAPGPSAEGAPPPLLAGERGGLRLPGFDLGNSPREMTPERVAGRTLYLTTSNGTRAILQAAVLGEVYTAAFVNRGAVAAALASLGKDVAVVCAGGRDQFALEDTAGAGALVAALADRGVSLELNDLALAAWELYNSWKDRLPHLFRRAEHGRRLLRHGMEADLDWCGQVDFLPVVPRYRNGCITPVEQGEAPGA